MLGASSYLFFFFELERLSNLVGKPSENHPLHNSGLLSLDPVQDKTPLYSQLLQAYKWSNKLQYHAGLASGLLNQQSLKRSANQMGVSAKRRPKAQPTTLVLPPQYVDDVISRIDRMFPEMTIHLSRPNGTSAMLLVTFQEHLLKERSVGHHLGSAHPYNQPLLSRRGMRWTGAQQAFSSRSVTQHLLPRLLGYSEPHVLKHCAPRYCGHSSLLTTFFKVDCHSVTSSSPTFSNHMDCSMPGFPVLQCFLKFAQTHVH
ncbi:mediator of RNA polymerase II transcription subunit 27 isoform X4 [Bubalus kerabau]|uniref:mediator of RNA polymerase II transcription subunit 27 isoform X4 n=1 Tax=Bubalus carabanensis TaxID=3119969 RepID=UPI00244EED04|nr:mediator of RNA polymerase II transcription subunit 27 isoform X4 [Bubalus carabanensis]